MKNNIINKLTVIYYNNNYSRMNKFDVLPDDNNDVYEQNVPDNNDRMKSDILVKDLKLDQIRSMYSDLLRSYKNQFDKELMDKIWEDWVLKYNISSVLNPKLALLRNFIMNHNQKELYIEKRSGKHRYEYHMLCTMLGLSHISVNEDVPFEALHENNDNDNDTNDGWEKVQTKKSKKPNVIDSSKNVYTNNGEKPMIITKPKNWSWEYTDIPNIPNDKNQDVLLKKVKKYREMRKNMVMNKKK